MKIEMSGAVAKYEWDSFKIDSVLQAINEWIAEQEIFDSESLFQLDNGLIESPTLVGKILDTLEIEVDYD